MFDVRTAVEKEGGVNKRRFDVRTVVELEKVDNNFVTDLNNRINNYFKDAESDFKNASYGNYKSISDKYSDNVQLARDIELYRKYIVYNSDKYTDEDYNAIISGIGNYQKNIDLINTQLKSNDAYFSQFANEEMYKAYEEEKELATYDLMAAATELQRLRLSYDSSKYDPEKQAELEKQIEQKKTKYNRAKEIQDQIKMAEEWQKLINSDEYKVDSAKGLDLYYADEKAAKEKEDSKSWFSEIMARGYNTSTDLPATTVMNQVEYDLRQDDSYKKPNDEWTQEDKNLFGYYYLTDKNKAYNFAIATNNAIDKAKTQAQKDNISKAATNDFWAGAAHTGLSILLSFTGLADTLHDMAEFSARGQITEKDFVSPFEYSQTAKGAIASELNDEFGTISEKVPIIGGKGWGDIYNLATSRIESGIAAATGGPLTVAITSFGSAAAAATDDALSRGATDEQAMQYGILVGLAESASEAIGADKLLKVGASSTLKEFFINLLKQGGAEGIEEGVSSVVGEFGDRLIMQDKSVFNGRVETYISDGLSKEKAVLKAWLESAEDIAYDMLGGFVSGLFGASPVTVVRTIQANTYNKQLSKASSDIKNLDNPINTNAVTNPIESYPVEKQSAIKSFINAVDGNIKSFVQRVKSGDLSVHRQKISDVSSRAAADIKRLLGIDAQGYTHNINTNGIQHILKRHGENGQQNTTMSNDDDIARMGWVLENYDSVEILTKDGQQVYSSEFIDSDGKAVPQIRYIKKINGTYYVVEAAFENERNKLWVQSTYLTKNKEDVTQTAPANNDRDTNARSASASPSSNNTVPRNTGIVNNNISKNGGDNSDGSVSQLTADGTDGEKLETMSFDNDEAGVGEPLSHEQKVILNSRGEDHTLTNKQKSLNRIAEKLGVKLVWDIDGDPALYGNGYYENGVIHMNKQAKAKATVFAHEYIHHIEQSKLWPAFKKFIEGTQAYKNWITLRGNNSDVEQATKNYKARLETNYKKADKKLADSDIIANFMAERFFGGDFEGNVEAEADAESLLREFAKNDKWYHNIIRFARQMISHFKGDKIQEEFYKMEGILLKARKEVQKNTPTNTGGRKYSFNENLNQQLQDWLNGGGQKNGSYNGNYFELGTTPEVLKKHGAPATEIIMYSDVVVKVTGGKHSISLDEIAKLPSQLNEPILLFKGSVPNSFVALTELVDKNGNDVIVAVHINKHHGRSLVNKIASLYSKSDIYGNNKIAEYVKNQILQGNLIDASNKKAPNWFTSRGLQLPKEVQTILDANTIISDSAEKSNKNSKNLSKSHSVTPASEADTIARLAAEGRADEYKTDKTVSKLDAERVADRWLKENKSTFDKAELTANIKRMIELSNSSAWGDVINLAKETAKMLSENSERKRSAASLNDLTMGIFSEIVNNRESVRLSDLAQLEAENTQYRRKLSNAESDNKRKTEQLNKQRQEVKREVELERAEYADRVKNRERIRRTVRSLDSKLRTNSNAKHVPEELQSAVRDFCGLFLVNDKATFKRKDLADLYVAYSALGDNDGSAETAGGYSEYIQEMIKTAASILDGKSLPQLNDSDLVMLRDITENLLHIVNNENEMFINGRKATLEKVGTTALNELQDKQSKKDIRLPGGDKVNSTKDEAMRFFGTGNLKPIYFFEQLGGTFKKMFNDMLNGQYQCVKHLETAQTFAQQTLKDSNYWKWIDEAPVEIKLEQGGRIKLTKGQAMALYATWKREQTNATQKAQHLYLGGIVLNDKQVTKKLNKNGKEGLVNWQEWVTKAHKLTPTDMKIVIDSLSSEQINFVDTMISYLSDDMAALGNTVSMELYGIKRFKEDYYFPYKTAENFRPNEANGKKKETKLKNSSFTKQTVEKANTPIVVEDFLETWAKHVSEMCQYSTMTLPIENMSRVFGFRKAPDDNYTAQAVRAEVQRVAGKEGVQYVQQLIDDLNGGLVSLPGDKWYQIAVGKFKKNAVFASASVVVQQPSAICRAFSVINPKYFVKTTFKIAEKNYAELKKYCPVAVLKEMGRFDVGTGSQFGDWITRRSYEGIKEKGKALLTDSEYRDDKLSAAAAKADEMTWAHIWAAAKAQTAATQNIKVGTEEFYKAAAKLFNEAIEKTQVYDSVLTRSENMRSKSSFTQMATAFMAESTTTLNMLWKATDEVKNHNVKAAGKIVGSVICSILLNSILKSFVTAARDDEEEKSYAEKYLQEVIANFTGDIGVWNMIPVIKDVASIFEGYTVDRTDVSLVEDLVKGVKALSSDNYTDWEKFKSVIGPIAAFFGLPVKNVIRDSEAAWNMVVSFIEGRIFASGTEMKYAALGALPWGDDSNSHYYELLYEAQHNGDEERYQEIYGYLISKGKDESAIRSGIRKFYRESKEIQRQMESYEEKIVRMTYYNKLEEDKKKNVLTRIRTYLVDKAISQDTGEELSDASKKAATAEEKGTSAAIYLLASAGFEDTDESGGISKAEKIAAINKMDISQAEKRILISLYTDTSKKKNSNK